MRVRSGSAKHFKTHPQMKTTKDILHLLMVLVALLVSWASAALAQAPGDRVPDHYIVELQPGANPVVVAARHGVGPTFLYSRVVNGFSAKIPPGLVQRVQDDPQVRSVTPDRVIAAIDRATGKPGSGGGAGSIQVVPAGVARVGAARDNNPFPLVTGEGVGVAIIDTGIDLNHADLIVSPVSFSAFGVTGQDDHGHGTHVAGIVAAKDNTIGVVGVAPGATLYAVKVLDAAGSGSDAIVMAGLNWVALHAAQMNPPIRVVNMSLGRPGSLGDNPLLRAAVQSLTGMGICVVVAAGNSATMTVSQQVPATYPEVMAVASSTARDGAKNRFNQFIRADTASFFTTDGAWYPFEGGGIGVTISAPGEDQENVSNGGLISSVGILSTALGGGTVRMSGTSMASPHTAGVAALLWQQALPSGTLTSEDVRRKTRNGAYNSWVGTPLMPLLPKDSPTSSYSYDGVREGVLSAPGALNTH